MKKKHMPQRISTRIRAMLVIGIQMEKGLLRLAGQHQEDATRYRLLRQQPVMDR